jgi:hypothetical protein
VKYGSPQHTLRELRAHMMQPLALLIFAGVSVILALIAPTGPNLPAGPLHRFVYWGLIVVVTYAIGYLAQWIASNRFTGAAQIAVSVLITAAGANVTVLLVGWTVLSATPAAGDLPLFIARTTAIAVIISVILHLLPAAQPATPVPRQPPALLSRLPLDKRGALVALSVEDHYVRVRTTSGEDVLLMRLSDAIRETGDTSGLQVHRSHWVARDQVTSARRKGDGAVLSMRSGPDIPVSRANIPALKEAGLLPR